VPGWDFRALFSILGPLSRFGIVFMILTLLGMLVLSFRLLRWKLWQNAHLRPFQLRLEKVEHNLRQLFWLNVILLSACSSEQLFFGIRSELQLVRNPNIDIVSPFDGLVAIVDLGFAVLAVIHCLRWWTSIQIAKTIEVNKT
jgi:hypothetical protein